MFFNFSLDKRRVCDLRDALIIRVKAETFDLCHERRQDPYRAHFKINVSLKKMSKRKVFPT